jgi:hypothetical protein
MNFNTQLLLRTRKENQYATDNVIGRVQQSEEQVAV